MADRYYVNSSNTKETQTVYIRRNEERIVFIGSQIHRPIDDLKSFIGAFLFDVNKWSKMMFVHQALREVDQNKENDWTVLLCTQGYTPFQINTILTEEEKIEYKHLYEIWMTNKYEVDGEILYHKGARYPVTAADTPEGLPLDMKMYWDIT